MQSLITTCGRVHWAGASLFLLSISCLQATVLSDNLSAASSYTEVIDSGTWIAAGFSTGSSAYSLSSVTALLREDTPGSVALRLYSSDSNNQPAKMLGTLMNPSSFSASLGRNTFQGNLLPLEAGQNYWLVLSVIGSGRYEWAYSDDNTGTGLGFNHTWGVSLDNGQNWFTSDQAPMQMQVVATPTSIPEPSGFGLSLCGAGGVALVLFSGRRRALHRQAF